MLGCPGAGKSTWIEKNLGKDFPKVSRDIIREKLGYAKEGEKKVCTYQQEKEVTLEENKEIDSLLSERISFVIDDTNLSTKFRNELIAKLKETPEVTIIGVHVVTPVDVCIKRREGQVPKEAIYITWARSNHIPKEDFDEFIEIEGIN